MRYHHSNTAPAMCRQVFSISYKCKHPVYSRYTLFKIKEKGIAIVQQYYDTKSKHTWWDEVDPAISNAIYSQTGFKDYFELYAQECQNGIYPTLTVRQVMLALRMKPIKRECWEAMLDHKPI